MTRETYTTTTDETSVTVSRSRVDAVRRRSVTTAGVRLYDNGTIGVAGGLGTVDPAELETAAAAALDRRVPYAGQPTADVRRHDEERESHVPEPDAFVDEYDGMLGELRKRFPEYILSDTAKRRMITTKLANDAGTDLSHSEARVEAVLMFKKESSTSIIDGGVFVSDRRFDVASFLDFATMQLEAYGTQVALPKGRIPVGFFGHDTLPVMKLAEDLHGLRFGSGASSLSGKQGRQLFSKELTVYQSRNREDVLGPFFDVEGTVNDNDRFALIDKGVVVAPYTDKKIATRFSLPVTGAATGEYDEVPHLEFPGLTIPHTCKTAAEILDGRPAILVAIASGGDFTPSGDFGTPVQLSYLYDGTKLLGRLPEFHLSGNQYQMFGDGFLGVSTDTVHPASRDHVMFLEMELT